MHVEVLAGGLGEVVGVRVRGGGGAVEGGFDGGEGLEVGRWGCEGLLEGGGFVGFEVRVWTGGYEGWEGGAFYRRRGLRYLRSGEGY